MNKSYRKLLLLLAPFVIWQITELFFLPINAFTFRAWETLGVANLHLPGPFYPNQDLDMMSAGDQQPRIKTKRVRFITDKYGFRNRPERSDLNHDIVVIGDSNIAGSHIDQENTISEVLERKCNCSVYNYAYVLPRNILSFFNDPRFIKNPPKYLVFEMRRGDVNTKVLEEIPTCDNSRTALANTWDAYSCRDLSWLDHLIGKIPTRGRILIDRFTKQPLFHFAKSRLGIAAPPSFVRSEAKTEDVDALINYSLEKIKNYDQEAKKRGIHFIFLFYPYFIHDVDALISKLKAEDVDTIAFLPDGKRRWTKEDYNNWIHKEDSHWLESSIVETADLIMEKVRGFEKSAARPEYSSLRSSSQSRLRR
jgi:hypothetical protein